MRWRRKPGWCINNHGHVGSHDHATASTTGAEFTFIQITTCPNCPVLLNAIRACRPREKQDEFATRGTGPSPVPRHCCFSSFDSVSERAPRRPDTPCVWLTSFKSYFLFSLLSSGCDSRLSDIFYSFRLPVTAKSVSYISLFGACVTITTWSTKFNRVMYSYNYPVCRGS